MTNFNHGDRSEANRLLSDGMTMESLAKHFGYSDRADLPKRLKKLGIINVHKLVLSKELKESKKISDKIRYRKENKHKLKESEAKYREKNRENIREKSRKYYLVNKEKIDFRTNALRIKKRDKEREIKKGRLRSRLR